MFFRLWHQLTLQVLDFVQDPCFAQGDGLIKVNDLSCYVTVFKYAQVLFKNKRWTSPSLSLCVCVCVCVCVYKSGAILSALHIYSSTPHNNIGRLVLLLFCFSYVEIDSKSLSDWP